MTAGLDSITGLDGIAALDSIAETRRPGPGRTRMCALTRAVRPERELVRFVAAPDGVVVPDIKAKLPGRGVWLSLSRPSVAEAVRRKLFSRGLKLNADAGADLPDQVAALLRAAALGRLGLARKAGAVVGGFAKVEAALGGDAVAALIIAADAAEDSRRKMEQAARRNPHGGDPRGRGEPIRAFASAELGLALGLPNVIHAAVLQSPAGKSFVEAVNRLQRYDGVDEGAATRMADDPQDLTDE